THLIPRVLKVALGARDSIELFGTDYPTPDGTAVRDYIHVEDLAEAHIRALDIGGKRAVFNLGHEKGYSVREVVDAAADITGRPIPLVEKGRRAGDPAMLVASSRRILEQCGWRAARSDLRMIVQSAWDWHQAHPDGYGH
ncbi:MAG: NAD-dependent epimerase/dehydratase family protein, partial [Terriglobia bacterium]